MKTYDLAVIGLGAMGSAALLAASRLGLKTIGVDRWTPPHNHGSTHGGSRIVREAIGEGAAYTPLAMRSQVLWRQLEHETGEKLIERCGAVILGGDEARKIHGKARFFQTTLETAKAFAIPHEILGRAELRKRFPAFDHYDGGAAYYEPGAGAAFPEAIVSAQIDRARELGADVAFDNPCRTLNSQAQHIELQTDNGKILANRAIIALGAWGSSFLPQSHAGVLSVSRQIMFWFSPPPLTPEAFDPKNMPVFIWDDLYGFPALDGPGHGFKVATEDFTRTIDPDAEDREVSGADKSEFTKRLRAYFPDVGQFIRTATCLYTAAPDFDFIVAPHPNHERALFVSACSGHGFKHAAAIGELGALWAADKPLSIGLGAFEFPAQP
jgi:sarcosine oxidase